MLIDYMLTPLKEAYVGKTKILLDCEKLIAKIIPNCGRKNFIVNNMKEVDQLEKLLVKQTGFESLVLNFYHMHSLRSMPNAYTYPSGIKMLSVKNTVDNMKKNKREYMTFSADPKTIRANVNVPNDLITQYNLTPGEVMALILHELGHDIDASAAYNFYTGFMLAMSVYMGNIVGILNGLYGGTGFIITHIGKFVNNIITSITPLAYLSNWIMLLIQNGLEVTKLIQFLMIPIVNPITAIPGAFLVLLQGWPVAGYSMENSADSFATKYGYGPELSTALNKIGNPPDITLANVIEETPGLNVMKGLSELNIMIVSHMIEPHPQNITRITNQMRVLEAELNDPSTPPSMKKGIKRDLEEIKKIVEKDMINSDSDLNKNRATRAAYIAMVYKATGGKTDIRDLLPISKL